MAAFCRVCFPSSHRGCEDGFGHASGFAWWSFRRLCCVREPGRVDRPKPKPSTCVPLTLRPRCSEMSLSSLAEVNVCAVTGVWLVAGLRPMQQPWPKKTARLVQGAGRRGGSRPGWPSVRLLILAFLALPLGLCWAFLAGGFPQGAPGGPPIWPAQPAQERRHPAAGRG